MLKPHLLIAALVLIGSSAGAGARPLVVSIEQLMAQPAQFNGKRVSFIGYYASDGDAWSLSVGLSRHGSRIFADFRNPKLPLKPIQRLQAGTFVHVVGTFRYVKMTVTHGKDFDSIVAGFGWMNSYDKEVTDITEFTPVDHASI